MTTGITQAPIERNMAMELVRVTEAAAIAAARHMGKGDKELVDQAAVDAMRVTLGTISMDGIVVIGEGEKDEAPMLYVGEVIGDGHDPKVDIAVDPIDGTTLLSKGLPGAIAAIALSARGHMKVPFQFAYMDKIAVGKAAKDVIDINAPVETNLRKTAEAMERSVEELTVVVLDRPRHDRLLEEIRATGARVKLISDGGRGGGDSRGAAGLGGRRVDGDWRNDGGGADGGGNTLHRRGDPVQGVAEERGGATGGVGGGGGPGEGAYDDGPGGRGGCVFCGDGRKHGGPAAGGAVFRQRGGDADAGDAVAVGDAAVDRLAPRLYAAEQGALRGVNPAPTNR